VKITWLTFVALALAILVIGLQPAGGVMQVHYSRDADGLRSVLAYPDLTIVNQARAGLAADMMFLLAYGFLLRWSAQYHGRAWVARLAIVLMAADAGENLSTLRILSLFEFQKDDPSIGLLFPLMNAFSVAKWLTGSAVLALLASAWWGHRAKLKAARGKFAAAAAFMFGLGGAASLAAALGYWFQAIRPASALAIVFPALALVVQIGIIGEIGLLLRLFYLIRVPLAVLLAVASFGPLAFGPGKALLGGILEIEDSGRALFLITFVALMISAACATQINLVRAYGASRTGDASLVAIESAKLEHPVFWTSVCAALSLAFCAACAASGFSIWKALWVIPAGAAAALVVVGLAELLTAWLSDPEGRSRLHLVLPFNVPWISDWTDKVYAAPPPAFLTNVKATAAGVLKPWAFSNVGDGYLETRPESGARLLPGHSFAITLSFLTLIVYGLLIFFKVSRVESDRAVAVPTLVAVLCLLLLLSWILSALAFLLDRYRVPLLAGVIGLSLITGTWPDTDFVFPMNTAGGTTPLRTPGQVLLAFKRAQAEPVVIAAAGGGIQAGAWTMRVLRGLDEAGGSPGGLRGRVALLSSVSGGSMGALYYGAFHNETSLDVADRVARESSLDEVASELVGPDVLRAALGPARDLLMSRDHDRGWALENTWSTRMPESEQGATLARWAGLAGQTSGNGGRFPAFLFNVTVVEQGAPAAFATTQIPSVAYRTSLGLTLSHNPVVENQAKLYGISMDGTQIETSLLAATAARLSAAFPYVSPASAPDDVNLPRHRRYHLVDGGYYDNYGLIGLTQWLDDALEELSKNPGKPELPGKILVIVIRGPDSGSASGKAWGWLGQTTGPPLAYLATRGYGQWAGGSDALKLLQEKWAGKNVAIRTVDYDYPTAKLRTTNPPCTEPPLNWKLTALQRSCIDEAWKAYHPLAASDLAGGEPRPAPAR
jgi:hypothetical protein